MRVACSFAIAVYASALSVGCAHGSEYADLAVSVAEAERVDAAQQEEVRALRAKVEALVCMYEGAAADFARAAETYERATLMNKQASADFQEAKQKYAEAEQRYRWMGYAIMLASTLDVSSALCASAQSTRSFRKVAGCGPNEHADHVLAHARGGANHPWNYVCLDASLNTSWRDGLWVKVQHMPLQLLRGAIISGLMKLRCGDSAVAFGR